MPRYPLAGITKLSQLLIDANKDWATFGIDSLGYVIIEDGAGHYFQLPSLTTAQRNALTAHVGMQIWNSDTLQAEKYDGSAWGPIGIAGVSVRRDSGDVIGTRPQLNVHQGVGVGLLVEDNPPDNEIDITYSSTTPHKHMVLLPEEAVLPAAGGAALSSVDGANFSYECLDFDHTNEEAAFWERWLSPDYNEENIVADIYWISGAAAGDAKFGFSVLGRTENEVWDAVMGTEQTVVSPTGGNGVLNRARITTFAPLWVGEDTILFKLARKAGDAADTIDANDVRVVKVVVSYTMHFKQAFYPLAEPVELTIPATGSWQDIDVSAYVPIGTTGVIIHAENRHTSLSRDFGLRKKGSTDNRTNLIYLNCHLWAMTGIDKNRKFQVYAETGDIYIYLVGYTATGVYFFDNAYDKSLGATGAWTTIDLSAECPSAIGVIVEIISTGTYEYGLRKNGSDDDRFSPTAIEQHAWAIIGCDDLQVIEGKIDNLGVDFFVVGYVTEGAKFKTNADDKTIPTTGAWTDMDCSTEAPKAIMLFFEPWGGIGNYGLRKNGSTEDIHRGIYHIFPLVACDANQVVEAYVQYSGRHFYLVGYATHAD